MNEIFTNFSASNFDFERAYFLIIALFGLLFVLFEFFPGRRLNFPITKLKRFIDKHLINHLISVGDKKFKILTRTSVISVIWVLLVLAVANPRWDYTDVEAFRPNINVVFLVDISKSMDAKDEAPSRLERAKMEIRDILKVVTNVNYGLVVFANNASVITPLTDDSSAIEYYIPSISTGLVGVEGSNVKAGIDVAANLFSPTQESVNYIVLLSDGEFEGMEQLPSIKEKLKNIKIFSFAFGTVAGAPISLDEGGYLKEKNKLVISKINPENLVKIGGKENIIKSTYLDEDVNKLKSYIDKDITIQESKYKSLRVWNDRFYIPLAFAMVILLFFFRKGAFFPIVILFFSTSSYANPVAEESLKFKNIFSMDFFRNQNQKAYNRFKKGEFEEAYQLFSDDYNKAVAAYKLKRYEESEKLFAKYKNADSLYNQGNSFLIQLRPEEAIKAYEEALKIDSNAEDIKFNLELAKKLLQEQKRIGGQKQELKTSSMLNNAPENIDENLGSESNSNDNELEVNPTKNTGKENFGEKKFNNELRIESQNLFSKLSGNPSNLLKARIKSENKKHIQKNNKPW